MFSSASEAVEVVRAGLGFLVSADPTQMMTEEQAKCLQSLEQVSAMGTAARTSILAAFTSGQGHSADADYSGAAESEESSQRYQSARPPEHVSIYAIGNSSEYASTLDKVGEIVHAKEHFRRSRGFGRQRAFESAGYDVSAPKVSYIEGAENFRDGIGEIVSKIYRRSAAKILGSALQFATPSSNYLLSLIENDDH